MSLSGGISKFTKKTMQRATDYKRAVGISLFNSVILDTPVDTGRARGNWQVSLNTPTDSETDQSVAAAVTAASTASNHGQLDDAVYLTNNLPYIEDLEFGSSKQAPAGMVRKNVARIERILEEQARKV